jgi:predicted RNA methylase
VKVICADAREVSFSKKADVIICEMLDTALIDEEQVPVLNSVRKYLKNDGIIIPYGIINCLEPVEVETEHICYEENGHPKNLVLGDPLFYSRINFKNPVNESFNESLNIRIKLSGTFSAIKITTFTLITKNIICGPTPMLNSPLIIPVNKIKVSLDDILKLDLSYEMGGGLESVRAEIKKVN